MPKTSPSSSTAAAATTAVVLSVCGCSVVDEGVVSSIMETDSIVSISIDLDEGAEEVVAVDTVVVDGWVADLRHVLQSCGHCSRRNWPAVLSDKQSAGRKKVQSAGCSQLPPSLFLLEDVVVVEVVLVDVEVDVDVLELELELVVVLVLVEVVVVGSTKVIGQGTEDPFPRTVCTTSA